MEEARGYGRDRDASFEVGEDWVLHRSCGFRQTLVRQSLLGICGASGSGKTTIAPLVAAGVSQAAVLEGDLLWLAGMATPEDDYLLLSTRWLMFALELAQGGMPLVLLGAATPGRWERNMVRRYIGPIHYLALVCDDRELQVRLRARRAWRQTSGDVFIGKMLPTTGGCGTTRGPWASNSWTPAVSQQSRRPLASSPGSTRTCHRETGPCIRRPAWR